MKTKMKKYPLWISLAVSCALIVASIFVLAFCGMKVGTSLGGGSQFEINVPHVSYDTKDMVSDVKAVLKDEGLTFDSASGYTFVWKKYRCDPSVPGVIQDLLRFPANVQQNYDEAYAA